MSKIAEIRPVRSTWTEVDAGLAQKEAGEQRVAAANRQRKNLQLTLSILYGIAWNATNDHVPIFSRRGTGKVSFRKKAQSASA